MTKVILLSALLGLAVSCGKPSEKIPLYSIKAGALPSFVNDKAMPQNPNLSIDKNLVNNEYPIEIALYNDNRFYYNLPNLGSGKGTWSHKNGKLELKAKRTLFDMHIDALATDVDGKELAIQFTDRFGPNTLRMLNINLE